jgi:hypothetical protein
MMLAGAATLDICSIKTSDKPDDTNSGTDSTCFAMQNSAFGAWNWDALNIGGSAGRILLNQGAHIWCGFSNFEPATQNTTPTSLVRTETFQPTHWYNPKGTQTPSASYYFDIDGSSGGAGWLQQPHQSSARFNLTSNVGVVRNSDPAVASYYYPYGSGTGDWDDPDNIGTVTAIRLMDTAGSDAV